MFVCCVNPKFFFLSYLPTSPLPLDLKTKIKDLLHSQQRSQLSSTLGILSASQTPELKFAANLFRSLVDFYDGQVMQAQVGFDRQISESSNNSEHLFLLHICNGLCQRDLQSTFVRLLKTK